MSQTILYAQKGESLSMKKLNQFLNILLSILLGIFIGNCIFTVMDHQMNPAAYAAQSAGRACP